MGTAWTLCQVRATHWPSGVIAGLLAIIFAMPPSSSKDSTSCTQQQVEHEPHEVRRL